MKYLLIILLFTQLVSAAPVTTVTVSNAAAAFVSSRFVQSQAQTAQTAASAKRDFAISKIKKLSRDSKTIGYIAELKPCGFVLMRSDDLLPALKLYSENGNFSNLPPDFIEVMEWELSTELSILNAEKGRNQSFSTIYKKEWDRLLNPNTIAQNSQEPETQDDYPQVGPLLSTTWSQGYPYNIYAPSCGGSRVPIGCVATAMSQILRYHKYPKAISSDYTYTDSSGSCQGTHSASDAGLGDYQWEDMLLSYSGSSSADEDEAVAQLMFHSAVTVDMNFEAGGSGAYSHNVPGALRNYFNYKSSSVSYRNYYNDSVWYGKINDSLTLQRPAYYSFQSTGGGGHAIVCDGCRNGNEIHLNFGWGGYENAWYDMNNVNAGGTTWVDHDAIFNITPKEIFLTYNKYSVVSDDNSDSHISPGETVEIDVQIINAGGLDANNVTAVLSTASAYVTVNSPSEVFYGRIYESMSANGTYFLKIATNAPNDFQEMQLLISCDDKIWTNKFDINIEHLPVIFVNPTNVNLNVEGIADVSASIVISNSGISDLIVNLFDDISSGSTNYSWADSNSSNGPSYLWQDISSIGTAVMLGDNDKTAMLPIGFDFPFYGENFSQFIISDNGGIGLTDGNIYRSNTKLPCGATFAPAQFIAPFWDDLDPSGSSSIYYYAEANQLIITWENIPRKGTTDEETFQAILRKNGQIIFQYKKMNGTLNSATVGIQGGPQSGFNPPKHAINVAYNTPFVTNELAVSIRPANDNSWIDYVPKDAVISPDKSNTFVFTCSSENLTGGVYNAKVSVMHNDPTKDSIDVSVNFTVYKPGAIIKGKNQIINNGEINPSILNNTDFGMAEIEIEIITNLFVIENLGTTNLSLGEVLLTSGTNCFTIVEFPLANVSAGSSTSFKLAFMPEKVGTFTGSVQIASSDEFNNPYSFSIIGKGIPEPGMFLIYYLGLALIIKFNLKN